MYEHIKDMATSLVEAGLATDGQQVELVLSRYWADKVAVVWTTEDVHSVQDDFDEKESAIRSLETEKSGDERHLQGNPKGIEFAL